MFISSAIGQGLCVASAFTYATYLDKAFPIRDQFQSGHTKERAQYLMALSSEKALQDGAGVCDTPLELLMELVKRTPEEWRLFFQILLTTGARPFDLVFLHSKWMLYDDVTDELRIEWRITKGVAERGKRHDVVYPTKFSCPWPIEMQKALKLHNGTFEHLGHKKSIASNANSVLKRAVKSLGRKEPLNVTTSHFRDHMEGALRSGGVAPEIIERMMHHAFDMGTAHYTPLTSQKVSKRK